MSDGDGQDVWLGLCGGVTVSVHMCPRVYPGLHGGVCAHTCVSLLTKMLNRLRRKGEGTTPVSLRLF